MAMPVASLPPADRVLMSVAELVDFFHFTPHPVSASEVKRWKARGILAAVRVGRADHFDLTAALVAHRDWALARERRSRTAD